jgi:glutaconate CoA-transferase subunit A
MSLVRTLAQSSLKDLTILSYAGMDLDLLIGAGMVKTAIFSFVSFEGAPGAPENFKRARQGGSVELKELSEYMFTAQLKAAAERLPFYPTRSGIGTDILSINPEIKTIRDPYTNQPLVAIPAFIPDYAIIHVNEADKTGNGRIIGDPYLDSLFVRAANKVIMTAERIVPVGKVQESTILGCWVEMVVEAPKAAYPGACYPDYGISEKEFKKYGDAAKDPDSFQEYLDEIIKGGS